jgi:alkylhydroperoxidase family enzyme
MATSGSGSSMPPPWRASKDYENRSSRLLTDAASASFAQCTSDACSSCAADHLLGQLESRHPHSPIATEPQLAALVVAIAAINAFNRVNAATRQILGDYVARIVQGAAAAAA